MCAQKESVVFVTGKSLNSILQCWNMEPKEKWEFRCSEYTVLERKIFVKDFTMGMPLSQIYKYMEE